MEGKRGRKKGREKEKEKEKEKRKENIKKGKKRPKDFNELVKYFEDYSKSKGKSINPVDEAEKWLNHFEANGYKVGKAKNPMQCWKSSVRTFVGNIGTFDQFDKQEKIQKF